jgi:hypothetical protein
VSWEGMSQRDSPFSRFDRCFTVNKPTKMIGVAGPQVFEMIEPGPGAVCGTVVGDGQARPIPPSVEQVLTAKVERRGLGEVCLFVGLFVCVCVCAATEDRQHVHVHKGSHQS